ncbi:MAG: helix-turn-helix domain-containing protein [Holophagales bacterium]|jgi:phage repressor protein C with HTH and peptisase S24 domain|nr:helix-turn-helix domain-containing protein [Holophagales bacterium]
MQRAVTKRLIEARRALKLSQRKFAEILDVHHSTVSCWELGKSPVSKVSTQAIEQVHRISADWLLTGKGDMFIKQSDTTEAGSSQIIIPVLSVTPCVDGGSALGDYVSAGGMSFSECWLRDSFNVAPNNLCLLRFDGDSMLPVINPDEMLFVDGLVQPPEYRDGLWVLRLGERLLVKRVQLIGSNRYQATSDNPADAHKIDLSDSAQLLGRVVGGAPKRF